MRACVEEKGRQGDCVWCAAFVNDTVRQIAISHRVAIHIKKTICILIRVLLYNIVLYFNRLPSLLLLCCVVFAIRANRLRNDEGKIIPRANGRDYYYIVRASRGAIVSVAVNAASAIQSSPFTICNGIVIVANLVVSCFTLCCFNFVVCCFCSLHILCVF